MTAIEVVHIEGRVAQYRLKRNEGGADISYYVCFVLDDNGIWKIQQF
jgi:hypothetical protein